MLDGLQIPAQSRFFDATAVKRRVVTDSLVDGLKRSQCRGYRVVDKDLEAKIVENVQSTLVPVVPGVPDKANGVLSAIPIKRLRNDKGFGGTCGTRGTAGSRQLQRPPHHHPAARPL